MDGTDTFATRVIAKVSVPSVHQTPPYLLHMSRYLPHLSPYLPQSFGSGNLSVSLLTSQPLAIAPLVSCHADEQSAPRTAGKSKQTTLFIQSLATISPDDSLWQSTCLFIA